MYKISVIWLCGLLSFALSGCTTSAVRQAEAVTAQADSLWRAGKMYGVDEGDSATLAQAYETLKKHSVFSLPFIASSPWERAGGEVCYHYGRLLRAKDNPIAAMEVFIDATHTRTHDYYILGRVYSNMGSICHLASEFQLSYDMYEQSGKMFLKENDSLAYYFLLNDMAFELAKQRKKKETLTLLDTIESHCTDRWVLAKTWETKAIVYKQEMQYDSAIYCIDRCQRLGNNDPTGYLVKAQAFEQSGVIDSALYYAKYVLNLPKAAKEDRYNMLYIISHYDPKIGSDEILHLTSKRADIGIILNEQRARHVQAAEILRQELNKRPDWRWLYAVIAVMFFICSCFILYYVWCKRKLHTQIIRDIDTKEAEQALLADKIENLSQQQEQHHHEMLIGIERSCLSLQSTNAIYHQLLWNDYALMCEAANRCLYNIVTHLQPYNLSEKEMRLCILVLLKASTEQMVKLIPYAHSGLGKFKYTTARKLGTTTPKIRKFILDLLV